MIDPHQIAERILGKIEWQSQVSGFCRCPGEKLHTQKNGRRDCRVNIDGAPTIFCFHSSCAPVVAGLNHRLRRELGASPWQLIMPGGVILRSGDVLSSRTENGERKTEIIRREAHVTRRAEGAAAERMLIESLRVAAERFRPEMFEFFHWPFEQMLEDSPLLASDRDEHEQFRLWLNLWPESATVWIGDVYSSGRPEHRTHFRPVAEWYRLGPVMGNFTCGSSFKPGSYSRTNENLNGHRFLVIESDTLSKDEVGAVFRYLRQRLKYRLHCVIDTGGKSLHGWFDAPTSKVRENRLKAGLEVLGCDPKVFTYSQPVRVPGAWRNGKTQKLIWVRE